MALNYFGPVRLRARAAAAHDRAALRPHRQRLVDRRAGQPAALLGLRRDQGGAGRVQPGRGDRAGRRRRHVHQHPHAAGAHADDRADQIYDRFPTLSPDQAAEMIVRALEEQPKHIGTQLGTTAVVRYALAPKVVDACCTRRTTCSRTRRPPAAASASRPRRARGALARRGGDGAAAAGRALVVADVYLEQGRTWTFACAVDWPGLGAARQGRRGGARGAAGLRRPLCRCGAGLLARRAARRRHAAGQRDDGLRRAGRARAVGRRARRRRGAWRTGSRTAGPPSTAPSRRRPPSCARGRAAAGATATRWPRTCRRRSGRTAG